MRGKQKSKKQRQQAPPKLKVPIPAGVNQKMATEPESTNERKSDKGKGKSFVEHFKADPAFKVEFSALVVGLGVLVVYAFQLWAMRNSNDLIRQNMIVSQRAFVSFSPEISPYFVLEKQGSTKIVAWSFFVPMKNSGATATKDLLDHVIVYPSEKPLSDTFDFHDFENGDPAFIGPQDKISFLTSPTDVNNIVALKAGKHVYAFGWAEYADRFKDTPSHVTKFCYELGLQGGDPTDYSKVSNILTHWTLCSGVKHNCADEECSK